jgi:hypothetical protein
MAIATNIPGLEITIEVDGVAIPKYDHAPAYDRDIATSTVKYIEASLATDSAIRYLYCPSFTPPSAVQMGVILDDSYIQAPYVEWGGKEECKGYLCSKSTSSVGGLDSTQGFRFVELRTGKSLSLLTWPTATNEVQRRRTHRSPRNFTTDSYRSVAQCSTPNSLSILRR